MKTTITITDAKQSVTLRELDRLTVEKLHAAGAIKGDWRELPLVAPIPLSEAFDVRPDTAKKAPKKAVSPAAPRTCTRCRREGKGERADHDARTHVSVMEREQAAQKQLDKGVATRDESAAIPG